MKVIFRVDSSLIIGTGHVVRCLVLATLLLEEGHIIIFACRDLDGNIISLIEEKHFRVVRLTPPAEGNVGSRDQHTLLEVNLEQELTEFRKVLECEKPDWVVVDHYELSEAWEQNVKEAGVRVFVIDDLLRPHSCDGVLDQNFRSDFSLRYETGSLKASQFLGPKFALISAEFKNIVPFVHENKEIRKILVFFGGVDVTHETSRFLRLIPALPPNIFFQIVVGKSNPTIPQIQNEIVKIANAELHIQTTHMSALMAGCDLFVGAGGGVTWERCYLGVPGICVATADNQIRGAEALSREGVHLYLGEAKKLSDEVYVGAICSLALDREARRSLSLKSMGLEVSSRVKELIDCFQK